MEQSSQQVEEHLEKLKLSAPEQWQLVQKIRNIFDEVNPDFTEIVKYNGLLFTLGGNQFVGGIFCYSEHLSIEFSQGAEFEDPQNLLEGKGKFRRHLKIKKESDIRQESLKNFVQQGLNFII